MQVTDTGGFGELSLSGQHRSPTQVGLGSWRKVLLFLLVASHK